MKKASRFLSLLLCLILVLGATTAFAEEPALEDAPFDGWVEGRDITLEFCEAVARLEPFGEGNDEPVFGIANVALRDVRPFGEDGRHLSFLFADRSIPRAVWWNHGDRAEAIRAKSGCRFDFLVKAKVSDFGYEPHPELTVEDVRISAV